MNCLKVSLFPVAVLRLNIGRLGPIMVWTDHCSPDFKRHILLAVASDVVVRQLNNKI